MEILCEELLLKHTKFKSPQEGLIPVMNKTKILVQKENDRSFKIKDRSRGTIRIFREFSWSRIDLSISKIDPCIFVIEFFRFPRFGISILAPKIDTLILRIDPQDSNFSFLHENAIFFEKKEPKSIFTLQRGFYTLIFIGVIHHQMVLILIIKITYN